MHVVPGIGTLKRVHASVCDFAIATVRSGGGDGDGGRRTQGDRACIRRKVPGNGDGMDLCPVVSIRHRQYACVCVCARALREYISHHKHSRVLAPVHTLDWKPVGIALGSDRGWWRGGGVCTIDNLIIRSTWH